ncbi:3-dehydroquinate synthase [bacterium]|nr:3-dehydroquinate synthase [candidate division CSSED10-310 bacterium]
MSDIIIRSNLKDYTAHFEKNGSYLSSLAELPNSVFVIDEKVWGLHRKGSLSVLPADRVITQQAVEEKKNIDTVCELYEKIMSYAPRKNMNLVSIGGGIIQDITGFVASSLYRGINWIFIPTTFLAQVDSCIGAKTSLNFKHFKNLVGTFYPPSSIHINTSFLRTLEKLDYYSGVGEMAKLHLLDGKSSTELFIGSLKKIDDIDDETVLDMIQNCLNIKKSYIEEDEFDTGKRNMLNYGHCFGHAIESSTGFAISHGQAVVVGMIIANKASKQRGLLNSENEQYIRDNVLLPILKADLSKIKIDVRKTIEAMKQDKKNTGNGLALVMLVDDYAAVKVNDVSENEAMELIIDFFEESSNG